MAQENSLWSICGNRPETQDLHKHYRAGVGLEALAKTWEFRTNSCDDTKGDREYAMDARFSLALENP